MDAKDVENKLNKLEDEQSKIKQDQSDLKQFVNNSINPINVGVAEIKVMLQERLEHDKLENDLIKKDIQNHESRLKKLEDNNTWLWRTIAGSVITAVVGAILFVLKMMK